MDVVNRVLPEIVNADRGHSSGSFAEDAFASEQFRNLAELDHINLPIQNGRV